MFDVCSPSKVENNNTDSNWQVFIFSLKICIRGTLIDIYEYLNNKLTWFLQRKLTYDLFIRKCVNQRSAKKIKVM